MKRISTNLATFVVAIITIFIFAGGAHACGCETYGQPRADARKYYRNDFKGAIFTGTVLAIKNDPDTGGITLSEVSIRVDRYWLGVATPVVVIRSPDSACGINRNVGTTDFFIASRDNDGLYLARCDLANWGANYGDAEWEPYTRRILGRPKTFTKP